MLVNNLAVEAALLFPVIINNYLFAPLWAITGCVGSAGLTSSLPGRRDSTARLSDTHTDPSPGPGLSAQLQYCQGLRKTNGQLQIV